MSMLKLLHQTCIFLTSFNFWFCVCPFLSNTATVLLAFGLTISTTFLHGVSPSIGSRYMDGTPLIIHARMLLPQGGSFILDMCDGGVPSIPDLLPEGYSPPVNKVKTLISYLHVAVPHLPIIHPIHRMLYAENSACIIIIV